MPRRSVQGERVLALLQQGKGYVSSQEICRQLEITRAAVWKQIQRLRRQGYDIEGVSSLGYRLSQTPDLLRVLETPPSSYSGLIGKQIIVKEETDSTNDDLWRLGEQEAEEGLVVMAEMQKKGKGRRGRQWVSPAGRNLYLSVLLRPPLVPVEASLITLMAAVQICKTMEEMFQLPPRIKWPNDVLLEGKKIAGILAEMHAEQDRIHFLILGIGININMTPDMFPSAIQYPATSLQIVLGRPVARVEFTRKLLEGLDKGYDEFLKGGASSIRREWLRYCAHTTGMIEVNTIKGVKRGRFSGLDEDGAMILIVSKNRKEKIRAGDVIRVINTNA